MPRVRVEEITVPAYKTVHDWVRKWRGNASDHLCIDCGEKAHDWCFDNKEPFWPSVEGPYYPDIGRYFTLCRTCHIARDQGTETCKNGHRWADGNRYKRKKGGTICRACRRELMRKYAAQKREAAR